MSNEHHFHEISTCINSNSKSAMHVDHQTNKAGYALRVRVVANKQRWRRDARFACSRATKAHAPSRLRLSAAGCMLCGAPDPHHMHARTKRVSFSLVDEHARMAAAIDACSTAENRDAAFAPNGRDTHSARHVSCQPCGFLDDGDPSYLNLDMGGATRARAGPKKKDLDDAVFSWRGWWEEMHLPVC